MPWRIIGGPHPAPWAGRDAVGWLWELEGQTGEYIGMIIWVSGTAMAIALDSLPDETAEARRTQGRSEIDRVLDIAHPAREILLTTVGRSVIEPRGPRFEPGWWVQLRGDRQDLEMLARLFEDAELRVVEREGAFYLRSTELEGLGDSAEVRARGADLLRRALGAARLEIAGIGTVEVEAEFSVSAE